MGRAEKNILKSTEQPYSENVPPVNWQLHLLSFLFIAAAVFLAYSNSLRGTWALDDTSISQYTSIEQSLDFRLGYRKVTHFTFLLNKWIKPGDPVNYRVFNIAIHLANAFLVYWLAFLTMRLPQVKEQFGRYSHPVALFSCAIFALHPININAVAYIVQRMTSLSAMFVLLSLISYVYARTRPLCLYSAPLYVLSATLVMLGIFSKENAVMALPLMLLYDYFFISGMDGRRLFRRVLLWGAGGMLILGIASVYLNFFKAIKDIAGIFWEFNQPMPEKGWMAVDVYWTPLQHIMTEFRVVCRYLMLIAVPLPGLLVFDYWGFVPSTGLMDPSSTLPAILIVAGLAVFAVLTRKKLPFLSFGILWYLIAISLESFVAVGSDFYFEHRNYLPSAGLFFGIIAQTGIFLKDRPVNQKVLLAGVAVMSLLLGGLTFQRNFVWKDSLTLWNDTLNKVPRNLRATVALGNSYLRLADLASASKYYATGLKLAAAQKSPQYFHDSAYSLGMTHLFLGNLAEARKIIELMEARMADDPSTGILRGFYSSMSGDAAAAITQLNQLLPRVTGLDSVIAYTLLGDTYRRIGQTDRAIENYKLAVGLDPSFSAAHYGMGNAYFMTRDIRNAEAATLRALELDPANPLALAQMTDIILIRKGPLDEARQYAERAIASSPPFYQPYASMATVLVLMGKDQEAESYFQKAGERGLRGYLLPFTKARAYFMRGDKQKAAVYLRELSGMEDAPEGLKNMISKGLDRL